MQLIGTKTSPYVRKARVAMIEKKLDFQFTLEDPWKPEGRIAEFNPLGKVPCLVLLEDEEAIFDSRAIVEYLDSLSPVGELISRNGRARAAIKTWEALADGILDAAIAVRLENIFAGRSENQRCSAWIEYQLNKVRAGIATMEKALLMRGQEFCMGNRFTLADIVLGCTLGWLDFRMPDVDWRSDQPRLLSLYDKLMQRKSFVDTVPEA